MITSFIVNYGEGRGADYHVRVKMINMHHGYGEHVGREDGFVQLYEVEKSLKQLPEIKEVLFPTDVYGVATLVLSGDSPMCINKARLMAGILCAKEHIVLDVLGHSRHDGFPSESKKKVVHPYIALTIETAIREFFFRELQEHLKHPCGYPPPTDINVIVVNHGPEEARFRKNGVTSF